MLYLMGRMFYSNETVLNEDGRELDKIHISTCGTEAAVFCATDPSINTGGSLWDCAFVLAKYLEVHQERLVKDQNVLELGSGSGLVGLVCWKLNAQQVVLTDLPILQNLLAYNVEYNVSKNKGTTEGKLEHCTLDWTETSQADRVVKDFGHADVIVAADVLWLEDLVVPFVETVKMVAGESSTIVVGYQERSKSVTTLFTELISSEFTVRCVPLEEYHPDFAPSTIKLLELHKKASLSARNK